MARIKAIILLIGCAFLLANCASTDKITTYTSSGQKVEFITGKSATFGAAPTTVAVMEQEPPKGSRATKLRPVGVTQGVAGETTVVSAIGGGLANGAGIAFASKWVNGTSAVTGVPGNTQVGSIFISNRAVAGGASATITH